MEFTQRFMQDAQFLVESSSFELGSLIFASDLLYDISIQRLDVVRAKYRLEWLEQALFYCENAEIVDEFLSCNLGVPKLVGGVLPERTCNRYEGVEQTL